MFKIGFKYIYNAFSVQIFNPYISFEKHLPFGREHKEDKY